MSKALFDHIAGQALGWLCQNLERMRLSRDLREDILQTSLAPDHACACRLPGHRRPAHPRHRSADAMEWAAALKPLAELVIVCIAVIRLSPPGSDRHRLAHHMIHFVWQDLQAGQVLYALLKTELGPGYLQSLYALLRQTGLRHAGVEQLAAHLVTTRHWASREEAPFQALDRLTAQRALGLLLHDDLDQAIARTWLGRTPEPWLLDHHHAYALTHTVFYLTNWGQAPAQLPPALAGYLTEWLPCWSQVWCEQQDWHLLGELLAVDACLPQPALDEHLWRQLAQAQLPDGSVPGLPPRSSASDSHDGDPYSLNRHPTIVAVLAATLAAARISPPATVPRSAAGID